MTNTARYVKENFLSSLFSTVHEAGHAFYELGQQSRWFGTPMCEAASLAIHESQSRLWENIIARSKPFWEGQYESLQKFFNAQLKDCSLDDFLKLVNRVTPSLIRVEADELTYNLHVMIRFEVERMFINEDVKTKDLKEIWNSKYEEYLGVTPDSDSSGVLQDVHWYQGLYGYFPTYTLGNLYSAQLWEKIKIDIPTIEDDLRSGNFDNLKSFLSNNIYCKGRMLDAKSLMKEVTGDDLSVKPLLSYFAKKYQV